MGITVCLQSAYSLVFTNYLAQIPLQTFTPCYPTFKQKAMQLGYQERIRYSFIAILHSDGMKIEDKCYLIYFFSCVFQTAWYSAVLPVPF